LDVSRFENNSSADNSINKLPITFHFKHPVKDLVVHLIMKSKNKSDIRVLRMVVTVNPKVVKAVLEMRVPYGEEVKQEIPIINNSDRDWQIKCNLVIDANHFGQYFSGNK
jgi:hypothetical protein